MIRQQTGNGSTPTAVKNLILGELSSTPAEIWMVLQRFAGPSDHEQHAMRQTVDVLFQHGYELVVATYDHLRHVPETAEILGWEQGADEAHLAERRRFFTIWLARTLSLDLGTDFADYLFQAGKVHAGHGPRHIHTPPLWVTGSMGLVLAAFAEYIRIEHDDVKIAAPALAGWNKYLMMQLNQMHTGYAAARALDAGIFSVPIRAYARVRSILPHPTMTVQAYEENTVGDLLRKLLGVAPALRDVMLERSWQTEDAEHDEWPRVEPVYTLRDGWRVLLNGQDIRYHGGFEQSLSAGDQVDLFPPGR